MIAASGQTREQAGQLVLQLSLFCTWMCCSLVDAVDAEETEAQALHAIGAAIVVDHREPRLPLAVLQSLGAGAGLLDRVTNPIHVEGIDLVRAGANFGKPAQQQDIRTTGPCRVAVHGASHGITLVEQRVDERKSLRTLERPGVSAFVEHYFERCLIPDRHT